MNYWFILICLPTVFAVKHICPDKSSKCPDSSTCCQLLDGTYGCCPLVNAVCCDDHIHCCPVKSTCSTGMCVQNLNITTENTFVEGNDVTCPDKQSACPDDTTCCKNPDSGNYSCCPLEDAVCCNDGVHCCPTNTVCNLEEQECTGDGFVTAMYDWHKQSTQAPALEMTKFLHISAGLKKVLSVVCPGSQTQCPNGYTCCKLNTGVWGCCPFHNASCCKDGLHCCPENMHCDPTSQFCSQGPRNVASFRNVPAERVDQDRFCPDHTKCEIEDTCCKLNAVDYGCCHYQNATCCSDFLHCCPSGNECDLVHKRCVPKLSLADVSDNYVNYFEL